MTEIARLLFFPVNPELDPGDDVTGILQECGFAGDAFDWQGESRFYAGPKFFSYLTFVGCSPAVAFEPEGEMDVSSFCHLKLTRYEHPVAITGMDTIIAKCRNCGRRIDGQEAVLQDWQSDFTCGSCQAVVKVPDLNWKHSAAFGRFFIEVWSIFPHEAIPVSVLLDRLSGLTDCDWRYAYIRSQIKV